MKVHLPDNIRRGRGKTIHPASFVCSRVLWNNAMMWIVSTSVLVGGGALFYVRISHNDTGKNCIHTDDMEGYTCPASNVSIHTYAARILSILTLWCCMNINTDMYCHMYIDSLEKHDSSTSFLSLGYGSTYIIPMVGTILSMLYIQGWKRHHLTRNATRPHGVVAHHQPCIHIYQC